jgi:hypothetical protein
MFFSITLSTRHRSPPHILCIQTGIYHTRLNHLAMDTRIPRPVTSRRAAHAATRRHVAATGSQTAEMNAAGTSSPRRLNPRAAPMSTLSTLPTMHGRVAVSGPRWAPTNTITTRSRQAPVPQSRETAHSAAGPPARNLSRVQPVGSATSHAAVGIVRSYGRRTLSLVREDDESVVLSARPSTRSSLTTSERHAAVLHDNRARRQPVQVNAAPIRSCAGSFVAATERGSSRAATFRPRLVEVVAAGERGPSRNSARFSPAPLRPRQDSSPLPPSPLRNVLASSSESASPRTYLDVQGAIERSSTRLPPQLGAPAGWGGPNYSPYSAGTTMADVCRRKELARKFPLPANAAGDAARERKFVAARPFMDAPVLGAQRGQTLMQECEVRLAVHRRAEEAEDVRKIVVVAAQDGVKAAEKKKGVLRRLGGFLGRKLKRKAKKRSSPSSTSPSPASSPGSPPSLVYGSSSSGTPSPPTPVQRRPEPAVVILGAPARRAAPPTLRLGNTRRSASQVATPSPARYMNQQGSPRISPARAQNNDALAQAAAAVSARPLQRIPYDGPLRYHHSASSFAHEQFSGLSEADAEIFPTPLNITKRWAPRAESSGAAVLREEARLHASLAGFFAQEEAAVTSQPAPYELMRHAQAELVAYMGKGKGRMVDTPAVPEHGTRGDVSQGPNAGTGEGEFGPKRKDTLEEEEEKGVEEPGLAI